MAEIAKKVTAKAENHSHHSLRPICRSSVSICSARKAPEPSSGEGSVVRARPRKDFIFRYLPSHIYTITVEGRGPASNRAEVQA